MGYRVVTRRGRSSLTREQNRGGAQGLAAVPACVTSLWPRPPALSHPPGLPASSQTNGARTPGVTSQSCDAKVSKHFLMQQNTCHTMTLLHTHVYLYKNEEGFSPNSACIQCTPRDLVFSNLFDSGL